MSDIRFDDRSLSLLVAGGGHRPCPTLCLFAKQWRQKVVL